VWREIPSPDLDNHVSAATHPAETTEAGIVIADLKDAEIASADKHHQFLNSAALLPVHLLTGLAVDIRDF